MIAAIKLVLVYFLMQIIGALFAGPFCLLYAYFVCGSFDMDMAREIAVAPTMLLGFVFMGLYLWRKNYLTGDKHLYSPVSLPYLAWSLLAGMASMYIIAVLMSELTFLPDLLDQTFDLLQSGWLGILCISVLGPILEELLFRGAITKELLRRYSPAKAILLSGLIFGIFHLNPAQIISACLIGFLLAWLYYKTRSLMACILIHIMNNGLSVYLSLKHPEIEDMTHLLRNPYAVVWVVVFIVLLLLSLKKLNKYNMSETNTTTEL
ncbi:type II CAAX endopeptidase family protein [uncultured Bacteroides sp.]|uniref:CPBP family intramembrane glutamic endopeptidase n=1 Tax=uncultured Bacteroides sp. TaxID=162156 RepID=UPI0025F244E5|nr:type II CAAX endopeptidase family protein [uncultured Bacteroides sp.]